MTTTLRPTGPIQHEADGAQARTYEVCVNSRPVGSIEIATFPAFSPTAGAIRSLRIDEADRRRGRGTVAALAAEEVLRGWRCTQVLTSVPPGATAALRLTTALGYTERSRSMSKELPEEPPALPAHVEGRPMSEAEFVSWRAAAVEGYAQGWIDRGLLPAEARAKSEAEHRETLPEGLATPGFSLSVLVHEGAPVGHLFVGPREARFAERASYVYDVKVVEGHRGQGHGRSLMLLAERVSLDAGTRRLALQVFTGNTPAIRLYESLGYEATSVNLVKQLL
ncbi:GNAT family N-acetyltransferase [Streptomyces sp. NBC_01142]|uniref:GNAT family N-acetyltransferase n=1 Tax=Streptomyces sp. NBC_01142 TaxID=2975865 RepID=UPI0022595519|nr:GNAT family N-acetyltransferase [Streptomyces sp. NBC_01142]MCX4821796.1 GNAT family N-acetyltransferase [Streptomyces sp. NBC_01142]